MEFIKEIFASFSGFFFKIISEQVFGVESCRVGEISARSKQFLLNAIIIDKFYRWITTITFEVISNSMQFSFWNFINRIVWRDWRVWINKTTTSLGSSKSFD